VWSASTDVRSYGPRRAASVGRTVQIRAMPASTRSASTSTSGICMVTMPSQTRWAPATGRTTQIDKTAALGEPELSHDNDRARRVVNSMCADRTKQQLGESTVSARTDDEQVGL
jgi:hypothetical protein